MKILWGGFNLNLLILLVLGLGSGCRTGEPSKDKTFSTIRLHLEAVPDNSGRIHPIPIVRKNPIMLTVDMVPFVTEADISEARVLDAVGGFAIRLAFTQRGRYLMEQASASSRGKHFAIFSQFPSIEDPTVSQSRWLAAPVVANRVSDGVISFTPDATKEEAYQIVRGLNNVARRNHNTPAEIEAAGRF